MGDECVELIGDVLFADVDGRVFGSLGEHQLLVDHRLKDLVPQSRRGGIDVIVERVEIHLRSHIGEQNALFSDDRDDAVDHG